MSLLRLEGLRAGHRGVAVVHDLDLCVDEGEVVALLGPNGAGKTTTLLTVSGLLPPLAGRVEVLGSVRAAGHARGPGPEVLARAGLGHVPEDRCLFTDLTTHENLGLALPPGCRRGRRAGERLREALRWFPELEPLGERRAALLSGGEQQMLAIARALVARPRLLLVDELSLGLAPVVVDRIVPVLRSIADDAGVGVLLVEQQVPAALAVANRAVVLERGRVVLEGPAAELAERPGVVEASYLGEG